MDKEFIAEMQRRVEKKKNISTKKILEEAANSFNFIVNYNPAKPTNYQSLIDIKENDSNVDGICEMANLRKDRSGLPVNLWLDDTQSYKRGGHWKRIKFQTNTSNNVQSGEMGVITIEDNPKIIEGEKLLPAKTINQILNWVKINKDALEKLSDEEIDILEFIQTMKKVDKHGNIITSELQTNNKNIN